MSQKPTIRLPAQGRTVAVVGDVYRFLATGEDTNGRYALWEAIVPPGGGPPPHIHSREEEGFVILEGEITFTVSAERMVAKAGTFANMPVGTPHSFKNESGKPAKMLISPAGLEAMFFEVGVPLAEGVTSALAPTREEIEKLLAVAPKYGIEIKLPGHKMARTPETMVKAQKLSDIDGYISQFPDDVQAVLQKVRETISHAAPDAQEVISYQMPAFRQHGILVYFAAWKNHIGLYPPMSGDKTLEKAVARYAGPKGNLQLPLNEAIPYDLIERIVKLRVTQDTEAAAKRKKRK